MGTIILLGLLISAIAISAVIAWRNIGKMYDNPMDDLGGKDKNSDEG